MYGFYSEQKDFRGQSFDTISSCGSNGAIIHYKPTRGKDAKIEKDVYLLDAGAHYTCGTTDTTRVTHCGTPTEFQKECYTRVLMGHINLLQVVFPAGTRGPALDVLSRSCLWEAGLEFKHGTGRVFRQKQINAIVGLFSNLLGTNGQIRILKGVKTGQLCHIIKN